jgi:hypothetical protein
LFRKTPAFNLDISITYDKYPAGDAGYRPPQIGISDSKIWAVFYQPKTGSKKGLTREQLLEKYQNNREKRAQEFRQLMEDNGWSQADLARNLKVSRAWVTKVMNELKGKG